MSEWNESPTPVEVVQALIDDWEVQRNGGIVCDQWINTNRDNGFKFGYSYRIRKPMTEEPDANPMVELPENVPTKQNTVPYDAVELGALHAELTALACNVEGMRAENAQREIEGSSLAYDEGDFSNVTNQVLAIADKMRKCKPRAIAEIQEQSKQFHFNKDK